MKLQRHRIRMMTVILLILLCALCVLLIIRGSRPAAVSFAPDDAGLLSDLKETVTPGRISDRTGALLASSKDGIRVYAEPAERRASLVHLLGETGGLVPGGIETLHAPLLYGFRPGLLEAVSRLIRKQERVGNHLTLTVSGELCEQILRSAAAHPETAGRPCCAVVIRYDTGEIGAMASLPTFDPQQITPEQAESLRKAADQPLLNRVTGKTYPLGSLAAVFPEPRKLQLKATSLYRDLEADESVYPLVTPLKLCLMTCAAAGSGQMPEPRVIREVTNDSGAVVSAFSPSVLGQYCSPEQADGIRSRMKAAVASEEAGMLMDPVLNIYASVGSAKASDENGEVHRYHWCTAFNRQPDLPWAVTVLVEDPNVDPAEDPSGSTAAALIARDLFAWLKIHPHWEEAGKPD